MFLDIKAAAHFLVNADNTVTASCCIVHQGTGEVFGFCKQEVIPNDKPYVKPGDEYLVFPDEESHFMYPVCVADEVPARDPRVVIYWRAPKTQNEGRV